MIKDKVKILLEDSLAMVSRRPLVSVREDEFGMNSLSFMQMNEDDYKKVKTTDVIKVLDAKENKYFDGIVLTTPEYQERDQHYFIIVRKVGEPHAGALRQANWINKQWIWPGQFPQDTKAY